MILKFAETPMLFLWSNMVEQICASSCLPIISATENPDFISRTMRGQTCSDQRSFSSSSLSSFTMPSSMLSSLSLWPSRYLGFCVPLITKRPPCGARLCSNSASLASLSMAAAKREANESRLLWASAWTWTEDGFSAEKIKRQIRQTGL